MAVSDRSELNGDWEWIHAFDVYSLGGIYALVGSFYKVWLDFGLCWYLFSYFFANYHSQSVSFQNFINKETNRTL